MFSVLSVCLSEGVSPYYHYPWFHWPVAGFTGNPPPPSPTRPPYKDHQSLVPLLYEESLKCSNLFTLTSLYRDPPLWSVHIARHRDWYRHGWKVGCVELCACVHAAPTQQSHWVLLQFIGLSIGVCVGVGQCERAITWTGSDLFTSPDSQQTGSRHSTERFLLVFTTHKVARR